MQWQAFLYVGIGGFLGANSRYVLSLIITERFASFTNKPIPFGTAFVNVTGSFLLAILLFWLAKQTGANDRIRLMMGTGFFGAYTTFSTFANESINLLLRDGFRLNSNWVIGFGYILLTNILCLFAVIAGLWLANRIF
jgi:fluoride exporter